MSDGIIRDDIDLDVARERQRQDDKWGVQLHPNGTGRSIEWMPGHTLAWFREYAYERCKGNPPEADNWLDVLLEEVFEAACETDDVPLRQELVQVAAVVKAWIETIDDRGRLPAFVCDVGPTAGQGSVQADPLYWEPCRDFRGPASCYTNAGTGLWCAPCELRRSVLA